MFENISIALNAYRSYLQSCTHEFISPRKLVADQVDDLFLQQLLQCKLQRVHDAIKTNSAIAVSIAQCSERLFEASGIIHEIDASLTSQFSEVVARSAIRQLWRDWSDDPDSQTERESATVRLVESLKASIPGKGKSGRRPLVLVPGSGLARFAVDLVGEGYDVEANEISTAHLFAVAWILEQQANPGSKCYTLHPWVQQFSNHFESSRQFDSVQVPYRDEPSNQHLLPTPTLSLRNGNLALDAGEAFRITTSDFVQSYGPPSLRRHSQEIPSPIPSSAASTASTNPPPSPPPSPPLSSVTRRGAGTFDAVATVFFIDTAQNVLSYIRTVHHTLRDGGIWLNTGPLLWHAWENGPSSRGEGDSDWDDGAKARGVRSLLPLEPFQDVEKVEGPGMLSIELSWDDLLVLLCRNGFRILEADYGDSKANHLGSTTTGFVSDVKSMGVYGYKVGFFKAQKISLVESDPGLSCY